MLKDFSRESDRTFHAELTVLRPVDQITANCEYHHEINGKHDGDRGENEHFSRGLTLREVSVIRILWIFAAPAPVLSRSSFSILAKCTGFQSKGEREAT